MFDSPDFPKSLDEAVFDSWLEMGRESKIPYGFLVIIWDEIEEKYLPFFVENRNELEDYEKYGESPTRQLLVAAFDLYSESKVI